MRIVKSRNTRFIENGEISGSMEPRKVKIQEVRVHVSLSMTSSKVIVLVVVECTNNSQEQ